MRTLLVITEVAMLAAGRRAVAFLVLLGAPTAVVAQPYGFVASADDSIAVLDLASDALLGSFPLEGFPSGSALSPDGSRLYVSQATANSLASIDTATGGVTLIPVGTSPAGVAVAPSGTQVYVANSADGTVSVIDAASHTLSMTFPVNGAPLALVAAPGRLYVASWGVPWVSVIDIGPAGAVTRTVSVGKFPVGLALDAAAGRLYVANFMDDTVSVVDTVALSVVATVPVVKGPRGIAVDPGAGRVYVAGFGDGEVQAIDTATNQVVLQGPSGGGGANPVDLALGPGGARLYVVHFYVGKTITVLDAATLTPLTALEAPAGLVTFAGFGSQAPPLGSRKPRWWSQAMSTLFRKPMGITVLHGPRRGRQPEAPSAFALFDGGFHEAVWNIYGDPTQDTSQESDGGNPGFWRRSTQFTTARADHEHDQLSTYRPSAAGAIGSIDVSWDRLREGPNGPIGECFVVFQGGVAYRTSNQIFSDPAWTRVSHQGLTAADFDDGKGGTPDFSVAGDDITFGYCRFRATEASPVTHGIDNFSVEVTVVSTPPSAGGLFALSPSRFNAVAAVPFSGSVTRGYNSQGAVSISLDLTCPSGDVEPEVLTWADGDTSPKTFEALCPVGPPPDTLWERFNLSLYDPTGGAEVDPWSSAAVVNVTSPNPPDPLVVLILSINVLLAGFSPAWLLALLVPASLLAARRAR